MDISGILSALTGQAAAANTQLDAATTTLNANTDEMRLLMDQNLVDSGNLVSAGVNIANQKADIAYNTASTQEQAQAAAGLTREDTQNEYFRGLAKLTATQAEREQVQQQVRKLSETSFFDSPIGYILDRLQLPAVAQKYNNLLAQEAAATENIKTRVDLLKNYNAVTVAANADAQREVDNKSAQLLQLQAQTQIRDQRMKNMSQLGTQAIQAATLADKKFDNLAKVANTQISMEQFAEMRAERAENRALRREEMNARLADKNTKEEAKVRVNDNLANVSMTLGLLDTSGQPVINSFDTLKANVRDHKQFESWDYAARTGSIGFGLADATTFFRDNANRAYLSANNPMLLRAGDGFNQGVIATANSLNKRGADGKMPNPKDVVKEAPEQYEAKLVGSAAVRAGETKTLTDKEFDTIFNPYRAPHALVLAHIKKGSASGMENNAFVDAISNVATVKGNGGNMTGADEQEALRTIGEMVKSRKLDPKIASVQVANYYKLATAVAERAYGTTAIFGLPKQTSYAATMQIPSAGFGGAGTLNVDLMNPADVERGIAQYVTKSSQSANAPTLFSDPVPLTGFPFR